MNLSLAALSPRTVDASMDASIGPFWEQIEDDIPHICIISIRPFLPCAPTGDSECRPSVQDDGVASPYGIPATVSKRSLHPEGRSLTMI